MWKFTLFVNSEFYLFISVFACVRSGGREITVCGRRLNVVQSPYIYFSLNSSYYTQVSQRISNTGGRVAWPGHEMADPPHEIQQQLVVGVDYIWLIQSGSSLRSPLSSGSNPEPAVNLSRGMFHSQLKTYLFSKSFPPSPSPTDWLLGKWIGMF